jgi:hypothetical protein
MEEKAGRMVSPLTGGTLNSSHAGSGKAALLGNLPVDIDRQTEYTRGRSLHVVTRYGSECEVSTSHWQRIHLLIQKYEIVSLKSLHGGSTKSVQPHSPVLDGPAA